MGLFGFLKKNKSQSTDIVVQIEDERDETKVKIGTGIALDASVRDSANKANVKYSRPDYNPQTRKAIYDDGNAHKAAIDRAFSSGKTVRDPYTGAELVKKQRDAKLQLNKIAARWPAKAVAQFSFNRKAVDICLDKKYC